MILGPKFDIKKKINNINPQQFSVKKGKINLTSLLDELYKRAKNDCKKYELSTIANNNFSSRRKNYFRIKSSVLL